jgi:hypothetical protein
MRYVCAAALLYNCRGLLCHPLVLVLKIYGILHSVCGEFKALFVIVFDACGKVGWQRKAVTLHRWQPTAKKRRRGGACR